MKIKGISVFEQHVEKVVVAGAILIACFFTAIQFLGPGNTVEIDSREYAAADVDEALHDKAEDIRALLVDEAPPTVAAPKPPAVLDWFEATRRSGINPDAEYLAVIPSRSPGLGGGTLVTEATQEFVVPVLAATGTPWVEQHSDAISAETAADLPAGIRDQLVAGPAGSYDLSWTTVAAILDVQALRAQIAAEDPDGAKIAIPPVWYGGRIDIVDLELIRQEFVDGQWGDESLIDPIFQTLEGYRERINQTGEQRISARDRNQILDWLREQPGANQALIIQPTFHATIGSSWTTPEIPIEEDQTPEEVEVLQLQARLAAADQQIAELQERLQEAGGPPPEEPQGGGRGSGSGGGAGGGGAFGGGGGGGPNIPGGGGGGSGLDPTDPDEGEKENVIVRTKLNNRLKAALMRRDRVQTELKEAAELAGIELDAEEQERVFPNLLTDETVMIWAHDMTAQQGAVYRYRLKVRIANPFYAKEDLLMPSQKELAAQFPMEVQPSEWTPPVQVKSHTRFFVTSAQPDEGSFNTGRVKLELYRLIDGQWHRKVLDLQPGDPITDSTEVRGGDMGMHRVDFDTGAYVLDVIRNPRHGGGLSSSMSGKAVIALPDGSTVVRDPSEDLKSVERLTLSSSADTAERQGSAP